MHDRHPAAGDRAGEQNSAYERLGPQERQERRCSHRHRPRSGRNSLRCSAAGRSTPGGWRSAIPAPVQAVGALHGGSFAACGRDAALKSGAPDRRRNSQERRCSHRHRPRSGRNSLRYSAAGRSTPGGWRSAIPAPVQAVGALHGGSFAACGRDAALKSGAPDRRRNSQERRCSHRHRPRSGRNSLRYSAAGRSTPGGWRSAIPAPVQAVGALHGGSFAACGRDAALKSGAPDRRRNSQERRCSHRHRPRSGRNSLRCSAAGRSTPGGWRSAIPAPVQAVGALHGGSFAACGRDAALKSGAPDSRGAPDRRGAPP